MRQKQLKYARQQLDDRNTTFLQEKLRLQQLFQVKLEAVTLELQSSEELRKEVEVTRVIELN